ncbi:hypothetical protein LJG11_28930, partial [Pseudomonas aeruginosa]|uniref:hypothetical protein n=1 Tax=Pseudomonas aeruginosa TaxID=287 RepID=UPI001D0BB9D6
QARLQVAMKSFGDDLVTTNAGGRVNFMNPVTEAMTCWTLQDAIGAPNELVFNVLDSDTGEALESPVRRCLQNTRVFCRQRRTGLSKASPVSLSSTLKTSSLGAPMASCKVQQVIASVTGFMKFTRPPALVVTKSSPNDFMAT